MQKTPQSNRKASEKTLLEEYAGQALTGLINEAYSHGLSFSDVAQEAFKFAKAMIKESERRKK